MDVDVEVKAHVTEMLNGTDAADGGCEGAGAVGGRCIDIENEVADMMITVAMAIMRRPMVMITVAMVRVMLVIF